MLRKTGKLEEADPNDLYLRQPSLYSGEMGHDTQNRFFSSSKIDPYFQEFVDARFKPSAIFSVDAPLDFESWWNRLTLNVRRGDPKSALGESEAILDALRSALGGSPSQVPLAYRSRSPFLASGMNGGNAHLLKGVPIRLYTEPDVVWLIDNLGLDYYTINAVDQAALVLQLRALGNTKATLITTSGKGYRPPGIRNTHSWSIVDEPELADWIVQCLRR